MPTTSCQFTLFGKCMYDNFTENRTNAMRRIRFQLLIPLLLAVLAACENNAVAPEGDTLTQAEASALIKGLYGEGVMGGDLLETDEFQLGAPIPLEGTFACSGGGTSALAGTMTTARRA